VDALTAGQVKGCGDSGDARTNNHNSCPLGHESGGEVILDLAGHRLRSKSETVGKFVGGSRRTEVVDPDAQSV
jgi:hypothetical protein